MATCKDCFHWNACKKMLEAMWGHSVPSGYEGGADRCEDFISTADVVPRAEVEKLHEVIFKKEDLMQKIAEERNKYADELEAVKDNNEHLKAEVAREIFKDLDEIAETDGCVYYLYSTELTELEKKYTEEKENG